MTPSELTSPNTFEQLHYGGVTLTRFTPEDAPEIFALIDGSRDHLSKHEEPTAVKYPTVESVEQSITTPKNKKRRRYAIRNQQHILIGSINITPDDGDATQAEIGYYLGEQFVGNRYMSEAMRALLQYAFGDLQLHMVYAVVHEENTDSMRVLERTGFTRTTYVEAEHEWRYELLQEKYLQFSAKEAKQKFHGEVRMLKDEDLTVLRPILEQWVRSKDTGEIISDEVEEDLQLMRQSIEGRNGYHYVVAEGDQTILGVMGLRSPDPRMMQFATTTRPLELVNAYVDHAHRKGRGIGKALVEKLKEVAKKLGYTEIILNSGSRYEESGWGFYDKLEGFLPVTTVIGYYVPEKPTRIWRCNLS